MKKITLLFVSMIIGMNSVYSQSQVDTIYYDAEGYGVEHPSFADYYRVTLTSSNPNKPNRYKDYLMDGTLISEGNFIKIDKDVESQSIFDGQCFNYFENKEGFFYIDGVIKEYSIYNQNDIIVYKIELTDGIPHGLEQKFDNNGNVVCVNHYEMGAITQQTINGKTTQYKTHNNSNALKISTRPLTKFVREKLEDNITSSPNLNNSHEIFLHNCGDKDMKIGIKNIYAVHCRLDNFFILPINIAYCGKTIYDIAEANMNQKLKQLLEQIDKQAQIDATSVTKTSTRTGYHTHYNDGKYGFLSNSKDYLSTHSQGNSTSKTLDKRLYYELLEKGKGEYQIVAQTMQQDFENFQMLRVDTILLPIGASTNKLIGFQTCISKKYYDAYPVLKQYVNQLFTPSHRILLTYDIVDLEMDTIIMSINELYHPSNEKMILEDSEYNKYNFVERYYYYWGGENDKIYVKYAPSYLYYLSWGYFDPKENKKMAKKYPEWDKGRKERNDEQIQILTDRLRDVASEK